MKSQIHGGNIFFKIFIYIESQMFLFDLKWKRRGLIVFRFVCTPELESLHFVEILKDTCWGVNIIFCISYVVFRTTNFGWGSGEGSVTIVSTFSCTSLGWEWDCRAAAASQRLYGLDHIDSHFYTWRNHLYKGQMKGKGVIVWVGKYGLFVWSHVRRVSSLKSHSLCPFVTVSDGLAKMKTKGRCRAGRVLLYN